MACASERMTFSTTAGFGLRERLTTLPRYSKNMRASKAVVLAAFALALVACRPPLHVDTLQLGSKLNGDNTVATHTTRFKPDDRIFAAVLTDATGSSTITVRWTYSGMMVGEESRKVTYKGAGATAFEFKSATAFPVGDYKVDILADGQAVQSREFRVE
jgi:hypothetical protein